MNNIFEAVEIKGKLVARNLSTGTIAPKGQIRDIQIRNAFRENMHMIVDPSTGRISKVSVNSDKSSKVLKESFEAILNKRNPEVMFNNLKNLTRMVGKGLQPSLVITGMAGMGKTHIVKETLAEMGLKESFEFVHFKGRATAAGLYITLYENSDKIIILDDCDSVFKDDDAVNILKGALDSYDTRRISYITSRELKDTYQNPVPRQFDFTGKVIFISNFEQSKIDEAIKSRSFVQDISMTTEQVFTRMEQLINKIEPRIKKEDKVLALSIMKELNETYQNVSVNLRSFIKASRICAMGFDNPKDMIADQIIED